MAKFANLVAKSASLYGTVKSGYDKFKKGDSVTPEVWEAIT